MRWRKAAQEAVRKAAQEAVRKAAQEEGGGAVLFGRASFDGTWSKTASRQPAAGKVSVTRSTMAAHPAVGIGRAWQ